MVKYYDITEPAKNRFILFYSLRLKWKKYHQANLLYGKLFPSKDNKKYSGNKTAFDKMLSFDTNYKLDAEKIKYLSDSIGISKEYFTGDLKLNIPNIDTYLYNYINSSRSKDCKKRWMIVS